MRIKTDGLSNRIVLETKPHDSGLPPVPLAEIAIKRILAPVDFSPCSRKALEYAVLFAKQFGAEVLVQHVFEPPPPQMAIVEGALLGADLKTSLAEQLKSWGQEAARHVTAKTVLSDGSPTDRAIVAAAEEAHVDLIVIGNEGRRGLARAFMGSTAELVVRHATCPVLVIRRCEHDFIPPPPGCE